MTTTEVEMRLHNLETKMDEILQLLRETHQNAQRMGQHIGAVETVMTQFQKPAFFVKRQIEKFMGSNSNSSSPLHHDGDFSSPSCISWSP